MSGKASRGKKHTGSKPAKLPPVVVGYLVLYNVLMLSLWGAALATALRVGVLQGHPPAIWASAGIYIRTSYELLASSAFACEKLQNVLLCRYSWFMHLLSFVTSRSWHLAFHWCPGFMDCCPSY